MALLESFEKQDPRPDEIIIVDDGSSDGTAAHAKAWSLTRPHSRVTIVQGPARGAGAAMNAGIRHARSDVIVRLDGHCRPGEGYLARSINTLVSQNTGVVGGVWKIEPGAPSLNAAGIAAALSHPLGSGGAHYRQAPRDGSMGAHAVDTVPFGTFRRELWEHIGGFDESLLRNQDYDFNYRVRMLGLDVILDPAIVSVYKARATFGALARQYFDYGCW